MTRRWGNSPSVLLVDFFKFFLASNEEMRGIITEHVGCIFLYNSIRYGVQLSNFTGHDMAFGFKLF